MGLASTHSWKDQALGIPGQEHPAHPALDLTAVEQPDSQGTLRSVFNLPVLGLCSVWDVL